MKRYLFFAGSWYYPQGGWDDLRGAFDTEDEAWDQIGEYGLPGSSSWFPIVDLQTGRIIHQSE